jgi:hypothetical protein
MDAVTRWERVEAGPGKSCSYIYTVSTKLTVEQTTEIAKSIRAKLRAEPGMKPFFDAGVTINFKYLDTAGKPVFILPINAATLVY